MRSNALAIVSCLTALACGDDPARSVKIIDRPLPAAAPAVNPQDAAEASPPAHPAVPPKTVVRQPPAPGSVVKPRRVTKPSPVAEWRPQACPPPPEDSPGPGRLVVTGPCAFRHDGAVNCSSTDDDFIIAVTRKAAGGATLVMYINVEKYNGPGRYDGAQMFLAVQDGTSIYRWSNDDFAMTVGPGEEFAVLPATRLEGEPLLTDCSRQIGPLTNYQYQCEGIGDAAAIEHTTEVVSGTLKCEERAPSPR